MTQRPEAQTDEFQKLIPGLDELETMGLGKLEQQEQEYIIEHADELELEDFLAELDDDERAQMLGWPAQGNGVPPEGQTDEASTSFYPPTLPESAKETFLVSKVVKGLRHILHFAETIFLSPEPLARIMELRQTDGGMVSRREPPYDLEVCLPEEIKQTAEHAAAFADVHPFQEFRAPDPLAELGRIVRWLEQLIETGRGGQVRQSRATEMRWRASGCKLIAQCRELCGVMAIRDDWAMKSQMMNDTKTLLGNAAAKAHKEDKKALELSEAVAEERKNLLDGKLESLATREDVRTIGNFALNYQDREVERRREFLRSLETLEAQDPRAYEIVKFWTVHGNEHGWQAAFARKKNVTRQAVHKQWTAMKGRYPLISSNGDAPDWPGGGDGGGEDDRNGKDDRDGEDEVDREQ